MPAFAVPLAADKLSLWEAWVEALKGTRKAEFGDMYARLGLTDDQAYLQPTPDGNFLVVVIQEGPDADSFAENLLVSENEFDRWFAENVADIHGIDLADPPAAPARYL